MNIWHLNVLRDLYIIYNCDIKINLTFDFIFVFLMTVAEHLLQYNM